MARELRLITSGEAAKKLKVHPNTVSRLMRQGKLDGLKVANLWLIQESAFESFARSREDSIIYKSLLRKQGIQVLSINEPVEDTPSGRLLEGIIEVIDEFYSANLAQDVVRGMRESASRGFYVTSGAPYGYRRVKVRDGDKERAKLEVQPEQAAVVARIFKSPSQERGLRRSPRR